MNKNTKGFAGVAVLIILSIVIVAGGVGGYVITRKPVNQPIDTGTQNEQTAPPSVDVSDLLDKLNPPPTTTVQNNSSAIVSFSSDKSAVSSGGAVTLNWEAGADTSSIALSLTCDSNVTWSTASGSAVKCGTILNQNKSSINTLYHYYQIKLFNNSSSDKSITATLNTGTASKDIKITVKAAAPVTTTPLPTPAPATQPVSTTAACSPDISQENTFFGCIYNGKNFDAFKAKLWPGGVVGQASTMSVQTPASLGGSSAYKIDGQNIKAGYATQPQGIALNGDFSLKVKGKFKFAPGSYTFYSLAGRYDGVRIKFDGVTKINQWNGRTYEDYFNETFSNQTEVVIEVEHYGNAKYSGFVTEHSRLEFGWRIPQAVARNQVCIIPYSKDDSQIGSIVGQILEACNSFIPKLESFWTVQPSLTPYLIEFITEPTAAYGNAGGQYSIALQIDKVKAEGLKLGTIVHELTHIILRPGYGFKGSTYKSQSWVGEGLAEYAPYKLGYPMASGHTTLGCDGGHYREDGYRCSATFFNYVDKNYPGFISKINKIMRTDFLTDSTLSQPNEGGPMLLDAFTQHKIGRA